MRKVLTQRYGARRLRLVGIGVPRRRRERLPRAGGAEVGAQDPESGLRHQIATVVPPLVVAVVGGDALESAISAASILAKTTRDAMMVDLCARYPGYGFSQHKGYGVAAHLEALRRLGPCPVHRRSFRPVREALGILDKVIVARQLPLPGVVAIPCATGQSPPPH